MVVKIERITAEQTHPVRHQVLWPDQPITFCRVPEDDEGKHYGERFYKGDIPYFKMSVDI